MSTFLNPDAVKDSSIAKSKLDTTLVNEINEINGKQDAPDIDRQGQWQHCSC